MLWARGSLLVRDTVVVLLKLLTFDVTWMNSLARVCVWNNYGD